MFKPGLIIIGIAAALEAAAPPPAGASDLAWMSGRWEARSGERWTEEYWSQARGGAMLGYSRSGQRETMREFEYLRLQAGEDGVLVYLAMPGGRPAVGFRLVRSDGSSATFENPSHDFPQRIVYRRDGDRLTATISALDGTNATSWTFERR
jgi:Domain of unknown function (DUF6265)